MDAEIRPPDPPPIDAGRGYEVRDANVRAVILFGVGLAAIVLVVQVGLWALLKGIAGEPENPPNPLNPPEVIHDQRVRLNDRERLALEGDYRWTDPTKGTVAMPIEGAMKRVAERGIPAASKTPRTSVDINSHAGKPAEPRPETKASDRPRAKDAEKAKGAKP